MANLLILYLVILIGIILDISIFLTSRKLKKLNPSLTNKTIVGWQNKLLVDRQLSKLNPGFYETNKALHIFMSSALLIVIFKSNGTSFATLSTSAYGISRARPTSRIASFAFIVPNVIICATCPSPYFSTT